MFAQSDQPLVFNSMSLLLPPIYANFYRCKFLDIYEHNSIEVINQQKRKKKRLPKFRFYHLIVCFYVRFLCATSVR